MKDCPQCKRRTFDHRFLCPYCGCSFGAERSEVLQGCPPSASGSARPIAVEQERAKSGGESSSNQLAVTSDRSARFSVRTAPSEIPRDVAAKIIAARDAMLRKDLDEAYHQLYSISDPGDDSSDPWAILEAQAGAPPAAGERAVARNAGDKV